MAPKSKDISILSKGPTTTIWLIMLCFQRRPSPHDGVNVNLLSVGGGGGGGGNGVRPRSGSFRESSPRINKHLQPNPPPPLVKVSCVSEVQDSKSANNSNLKACGGFTCVSLSAIPMLFKICSMSFMSFKRLKWTSQNGTQEKK